MSISAIAHFASVKPVINKSLVSILFRMQALVARINTQLGVFSEQSQTASQKKKREYQMNTAKTADFQRQIGDTAYRSSLWSLALTGGCGTICAVLCDKNVQLLSEKYAGTLSGLCAGVGNLKKLGGDWHAQDLSAKQTITASTYSILQTEMNNEGQKSSEAQDFKSMLTQFFSGVLELYKKASG